MRVYRLTCLAAALAALRPAPAVAQEPATHLLFVTLDGLRWQEAFGGADSAIVWGRDDSATLAQRWWRPTREERRALLLPFIWSTMAERGQLLGDRQAGGGVRVTNGKNFSYPGYNELLTGRPDPGIDSNDKVPNPNVTVLEWLARRPGFVGGVRAVASWDAFPAIINAGRSGIPVGASASSGPSAALAPLLPALWTETRLDALTHLDALALLRDSVAPRVLYVALGETDEWAHAGEYALYLDAARRNDATIRALYEAFAAHPAVRGSLALLVTVDHGRGDGPAWTDHGRDVPVAQWIWVAAMGPGVASRGSRGDLADATQSQVAATVAALVGEDYAGAVAGVARPLPLTQAPAGTRPGPSPARDR